MYVIATFIGLAMWTDEVLTIELQKTERGLGFSILDYQDPLNPSETVIVIRSLVPGGVAQQDGRLIPGDRLMFVNNIPLGNASLDTAVQALKGAAQGTVLIGVSKPLPVTDSQITTENTSEEDTSQDNTEVRSAVSDMDTDPANNIKIARNDSISRSVFHLHIKSMMIIHHVSVTFLIYPHHYQHPHFLMMKMRLTEAGTATVRNLSSRDPAPPGTVSRCPPPSG